MMKDSFLNFTEKRRSIYSLGKREVLGETEIVELVEKAVKYCPSAFNSQSARAVVLFGKNYHRFWEIVSETLKAIVPEKAFEATEKKLESFRNGLGTVLFFEDMDVVKGLQERFPLYADNFPKWSLQSNGMLEYIVWTAFSERNIGASLQHYNPLIDKVVAKEWSLPESWQLLAQMPFGSIEAAADDKTFESIEKRVKVFK